MKIVRREKCRCCICSGFTVACLYWYIYNTKWSSRKCDSWTSHHLSTLLIFSWLLVGHRWDRLLCYGSLCPHMVLQHYSSWLWKSLRCPLPCLNYILCLTKEPKPNNVVFLPCFPSCQGTGKALPRQDEFLSRLTPVKFLTFLQGRIIIMICPQKATRDHSFFTSSFEFQVFTFQQNFL